MAEVQPLNIPTTSKLTEAREFLCEAVILVSDVKSLFFNSGDFAIVARLKDIQGRHAVELRTLERLIAASKPAFAINCGVTALLMCMAVTTRGLSAVKGRAASASAKRLALDGASSARATLRPRT